MPNEPEQQQQRRWWSYNLGVYAGNVFKRIPGIKGLFRRRTAITKEGKLKEPSIVKQELRALFELNDRLIGELRTIEDRWNIIDAIIGGGPELPEGLAPLVGDVTKNIQGFYSGLGPYTDPNVVALETSYFEYGSNVSVGTTTLDINSVIQEMRNSLATDEQKATFDEEIRNLTQRDIEEIRSGSAFSNINMLGGEMPNDELRSPLLTQEELEEYARFLFNDELSVRRALGELIENEEEFLNQLREEERLRRGGTEKLYAFGWQKIEYIKALLAGLGRRFEETAEGATGIPAIDLSVRGARTRLFREVTTLLDAIGRIEREQWDHLRNLDPFLSRFEPTRTAILTNAPERVRFKHTYMVIKPFVTIETPERLNGEIRTVKKPIYFDNRRNPPNLPPEQRPQHMKDNRIMDNIEEWQRPSERDAGVPPGYDENGYPLEINQNGEVLLDIWWNEIAQNNWQRETIAKKPGGREVLIKELSFQDVQVRGDGTVTFIGRASRPIRRVDTRWMNTRYGNPYIDLLDMALYISNEYDTFRDDFRDGRYHPYSKTAVDYTIAAEGGFDVAPYFRKPTHVYREIPNVKKMYRIARRYNEFSRDDYINRTPMDFERNLPFEEKAVTRKYEMKLLNIAEPIKGERVPAHTNPAFDLRALNRDGSRVLWGRMLYYEWPDGVNKWSENPFPTISSRGIAQFLLDRILRDLYDYDDQKRTMIEFTREGYDYGVRRPLVGGSKARFPKDLIGGTDVVQSGVWFPT